VCLCLLFTLCVWCLVFLSTGLVLLPLEMKKNAAQRAAAEAAALLVAVEAVPVQEAALGLALALVPVPPGTDAGMTAETIVVGNAVNLPANKSGVMVTGNVTIVVLITLLPVMLASNAESLSEAVAAVVEIEDTGLVTVMEEEEEVVEDMEVTEGTTVAVTEVAVEEAIAMVAVTVTVAAEIGTEAVVATVMEAVVIAMAVVVAVEVAVVMVTALLALLLNLDLVIGTVIAARDIILQPSLPASAVVLASLKNSKYI
jgi:hypothetical protein